MCNHFFWPQIAVQVKEHAKKCYQCITFKAKQQRVPIGSIVDTHPRKLVHFNYLCLQPGRGKEENILAVTGHFTQYTQAYVIWLQIAQTMPRYCGTISLSIIGCQKRSSWTKGRTLRVQWWNWTPSSILISHLHWNTKEMECPRTGSLWSILCYNQMELLPPNIWYHSPYGHKPLAKFLNGKNANNEVNRWGLGLATYNITFEWISGTRNKPADCLSRLVKLPNNNEATVMMLTATNLDGPAFSTRSQTSQQHQTAKDLQTLHWWQILLHLT